MSNKAINVVFDGPPSAVSGRFVEVELDDGSGVNAGEWIERPDGKWALRITDLPPTAVSMVRFVTYMGPAPLWEKKPGVMICTQEHHLGLSIPEARQLLHDLAQAINEGEL